VLIGVKVVEINLFEAGFDVEWEDLAVPDLNASGEWPEVKRPHWALKVYKLPTCKFLT
jgi:protein arginine N-methyltransferase 2